MGTHRETASEGGASCPSCGSPVMAGHTTECRNTREQVEGFIEEYEAVTDKMVDDALDYIESVFDFNLHEQNFVFHGREHTQTVIARVEQILQVLKEAGVEVSRYDIALGRLIAAKHDAKQVWTAKTEWKPGSDDERFGKVERVRAKGDSESASFEDAIAEMEQANVRAGKEIFPQADMDRLRAGIRGTEVDFDDKLGTVVQPESEGSSDVIVRALALADLGDAGMGGPEVFLKAGDNFFVEVNMDMWNLDVAVLSDEQKQYYQKRMVGWNKFQIVFAKGREAKLEAELSTLPEQARDAVRGLFTQFDASIQAASERAATRERMSFEELYREMGFRPAQKEALAA